MNNEQNTGRAQLTGRLNPVLCIFCFGLLATSLQSPALSQQMILKPVHFARYVDNFNAMEDEPVVNLIPNVEAWNWMVAPLKRRCRPLAKI